MSHIVRVTIETLGCKLNQAESEALARAFRKAGYDVVSPGDSADVYILNSCTVTHIADRKSRHLLRMARRLNPEALIVAAGCYAERAQGELGAVADLVIPNSRKGSIVEAVRARMAPVQTGGGRGKLSRTRAFIKAQDGCNRRCAYCIVPLVRGAQKSLPPDEVIAQVTAWVREGYSEVVLTGTEIGAYACEGMGLQELLRHILAESGSERLRVSSLQPYEITPGLLDMWKDPRLCPHFHISLQSGADSVLSRMKRGYTTADYARALSLIRKKLPDAAITTDVIVGFPGETEAEFQQCLDFCRKAGFARIHVFPYSPRPGTAAACMPGQVDARVKKARTRAMLALAEESASAFQSGFLGNRVAVLWEQRSAGGVWSGYSANYMRVYARSVEDLTGVLGYAKLTRIYRDGLWAEITL